MVCNFDCWQPECSSSRNHRLDYFLIDLGRTASWTDGQASKNLESRGRHGTITRLVTFQSTWPRFLKLNNGEPIDYQIARRTFIPRQDLSCPNGWLHEVMSPRGAHNLGHLGVNLSAGHMNRANRRNLPPACGGRSTRCMRPHSVFSKHPRDPI